MNVINAVISPFRRLEFALAFLGFLAGLGYTYLPTAYVEQFMWPVVIAVIMFCAVKIWRSGIFGVTVAAGKVALSFRRPKLAMAAIGALAFVLLLTLAPMTHIDKFGFLVAAGVGTYFLVLSGKAMRNRYGNLAVVMFYSALLMLLSVAFFTDQATLSASALEDLSSPIIGGIGGVFSTVEDSEQD